MTRRTPLDLLDSFISTTVSAGLVHRTAEDRQLNGRTIRLGGKDLLQFGSCSYLGLEHDPRLRRAACDAAERFGTQFSSSRSYVSAPLYDELEEKLEQIFGGAVLVTPSTTLGHLAALPSLVHEHDVLLLDHQVHHSVQMAAQVARSDGCKIELLPHNDIPAVEELATRLARDHRRVWVIVDGVYSMFGDLAPVEDLWALADRIPNLWLYVDDAHGMGWCGPRGCGSVLSRVPLHERVIVATSLNKSFAAAGGCLVFGESDARRRVRTVGGPMIFSGPVQPPMLGAGIASAGLHLSDELPMLQAELRDRIALTTRLLRERGLPLVSTDGTPILFVGVGLPRVARNLAARLLNDGFYTNISHFPAVPMRKAGVRFTLTRHQQAEDVTALADAFERHFERAFDEEGQDPARVWSTFGLARPEGRRAWHRTPRITREIDEFDSIRKIPQSEWDSHLGSRGIFSWDGLRFLEKAFSGQAGSKNDWRFRYYVVRDDDGRPIAATFFTAATWKLDMMEDAEVSRAVERIREREPDFLTARVFAMGSLLTEGNHLFIDSQRLPSGSPAWEKSLSALLTHVGEHAQQEGAEFIALRDLPANDPTLEDFLTGQGFVRSDAPERFVAEVFATEEEQLQHLSSKQRHFQGREVRPWNDAFDVEVIDERSRPLSGQERTRLFELYDQVKQSSFEINTFSLPGTIFDDLLETPGWEILLFRPRSSAPDSLPVGMGACFRGAHAYCPTIVGLDYDFVRTRGLYRQNLRAVFARARRLGYDKVQLGMGAGLQKRRFGAAAEPASIYMLAEDHYAFDILAEIRTQTRRQS